MWVFPQLYQDFGDFHRGPFCKRKSYLRLNREFNKAFTLGKTVVYKQPNHQGDAKK